MHESSLLHLIQKVRSCISWGDSDSNFVFRGLETMDNDCSVCCHCKRKLSNSYLKYHCLSCGRLMCGNCIQGLASFDGAESTHLEETNEAMFNVKSCKLCSELGPLSKSGRRCSGKVHPSESTRQGPEPPSPNFSGERFAGHCPREWARSSDASFLNHPSSSGHCSLTRSDEDEEEDPASHLSSTADEYFHEAPNVDSCSVSARHDCCSFMSVGSSPSDSPSRLHITSTIAGQFVQIEQEGNLSSQNDSFFDQELAVLERPTKGICGGENANGLSAFEHKCEKFPKPADFETSDFIWLPPPPDDVYDEVEKNIFTYDDEDDEVGDSGLMFCPTAVDDIFFAKEKQHLDYKVPWRDAVEGHFRALVLQLLEGQGIIATEDHCTENWLDIITAIAWQAAKFIKPDRNRGGSMDPCDYLKVKCVASGSPSESKLIKGIVCTKNIKHKRMMSQFKNARLLLLGGALEYQRVPNRLASFETLLQQENDNLKTIVSKIEAHRPNVLLVEKSVSSFALEHLLEKEISLVLNIKRPLLEQIARCTGASITPSIDHISTTRLGHCELFHLEKISVDHEPVNQFNKKPSKTLMFFEGCPWRLCCTVVLRGSYREELKKVKHVVQYAVFAAYHLLLETSFLADEGANLPKMPGKLSFVPEKMALNKAISAIPDSALTTICREEVNVSNIDIGSADHSLGLGLQQSLSELADTGYVDVSLPDEFRYRKALSEACDENLTTNLTLDEMTSTCPSIRNHTLTESLGQQERQSGEVIDVATPVKVDDPEASSEHVSANDINQSILVSFSSHCVVNGTVCERSRLLRIKFYGPSDKPLGRYLRDNLFDQSYICQSCKESAEAHVLCYTHQHANLTINVRHLPSVKLPGEQDGKIWMWHRCLRCAHIQGVPPATRRVVMSNAAWGLSFGKFLELSFFSNHVTGNRVANCGHSLQRDCLRFYGFGSMVAFFRYSPINILSVHLPPSILEFSGPDEQSWIAKEAYELLSKAEALHAEISDVLEKFKIKSLTSVDELSYTSELHNHVLELIDILSKERSYYKDFLQLADKEIPEQNQVALDILEINHLRRSLLIGSHVWDRRLHLLDSLLKRSSGLQTPNGAATLKKFNVSDIHLKVSSLDLDCGDDVSKYPTLGERPNDTVHSNNEGHKCSWLEPSLQESDALSAFAQIEGNEIPKNAENTGNITSLQHCPSAASILSDKIDSAWSGTDQATREAQLLDTLKTDVCGTPSFRQVIKRESPPSKRLLGPARFHSFDSVQRLKERMMKGLPPALYLHTVRSFHASGDYRYMVRDPVINLQRTYSEVSPGEAEKLNISSSTPTSFISSVSFLPEGARLMVLQNGQNDIVVTVYDNEPTSIISYALSSKEYEDWVTDKSNGPERGSNVRLLNQANSLGSDLSSWQSFGSLDSDYTNYGSYSSEDASPTVGSLFADNNKSPHLRISFEDASCNAAGKAKFSVTCYFAKQFDALQRRCCPNIVDFLQSLSRCRRWSAQGGKSNVYFAKSFDDRFIIKQVTKTELDSFEEFALEYFKYLTDVLSSGSPTCLAKILGIYQVNVKHMKGGKEVKMDLMLMENLFFKRSISKVYDLKGSARSRYNSDSVGANKVLLDTNLLETLRTNPIFLGSKAKRSLERAVWNDTSFLASVDVIDYSLLVGVDEERMELVMGIIDFMRQYTWDKQLETWVKASGILGGPKNASPTIISPKQYKKRFRKAMTTYFLTVPDRWSS